MNYRGIMKYQDTDNIITLRFKSDNGRQVSLTKSLAIFSQGHSLFRGKFGIHAKKKIVENPLRSFFLL